MLDAILTHFVHSDKNTPLTPPLSLGQRICVCVIQFLSPSTMRLYLDEGEEQLTGAIPI